MKRTLGLIGVVAALALMTAWTPAEARAVYNKMSANKMMTNKMSANKMSANRMSANKMSANKMSANKMSANKMMQNHLSSNKVLVNKCTCDRPAVNSAPRVSGNALPGEGSVTGIAVIELADGTQFRR